MPIVWRSSLCGFYGMHDEEEIVLGTGDPPMGTYFSPLHLPLSPPSTVPFRGGNNNTHICTSLRADGSIGRLPSTFITHARVYGLNNSQLCVVRSRMDRYLYGDFSL